MARLTKKIVESIVITDKDQYVWETTMAGFGVRVRPSGRRTYIVQYRLQDGKQRKRTVGHHGVVTAEQARNKVQAMLAEVQLGGDPIADAIPSTTVSELSERYLHEYSIP